MILSEEVRLWLADKIKHECRTVRAFAKKVSLSESAMCRILKGNRRMMKYHYTNFARALNMEEEEFSRKMGGSCDEHGNEST